jgi:hypothetical protein
LVTSSVWPSAAGTDSPLMKLDTERAIAYLSSG